MKIAQSQVQLAALRNYERRHHVEERLQIQWGNTAPARPASDRVELSPQAQGELQKSASTPLDIDPEVLDKMAQKAQMVAALLSAFLGKKVKVISLEELARNLPQNNVSNLPKSQEISADPGFGLSYDYREVFFEHEQVSLSFQGSVLTGDGREINFSLDLDMERTLYEENSLSLRMGNMVDPLIINFGTATAGLSEERFLFDLTADGVEELIPTLGAGSGFLVLDKNKDGVVNDGSELFGTQSGNGFRDLAAYDSDGNGWIDESDPVFADLLVWVPGAEEGELYSLTELGIGALYLGSVSAQFSLTATGGDLLGQQQRAGLFLHENGRAGTLQHVDLSV